MSAATMNEVERLRKDRDEWKQQAEAEAIVADSYRDERDAALEREQALAAHVERLQLYGNQMMKSMDQKEAIQTMKEFEGALKSKPATSLTKRDLIKQAEALEEFMLITADDPRNTLGDSMRANIIKLRQQAAALNTNEDK